MRGNFKTAYFLALKDILKNKRVIILVLASLAFSFVNILFTASIIKGFSITPISDTEFFFDTTLIF